MGVMEEFKSNFEERHNVEVLLEKSIYTVEENSSSTYVWNPLVIKVDKHRLNAFIQKWGISGKHGPINYLSLQSGEISFTGGYGKDIAPLL